VYLCLKGSCLQGGGRSRERRLKSGLELSGVGVLGRDNSESGENRVREVVKLGYNESRLEAIVPKHRRHHGNFGRWCPAGDKDIQQTQELRSC
jgi:hypothetical protein